MSKGEELVALLDYTPPPAFEDGYLKFKKDDKFHFISEVVPRCWRVKHLPTGKRGRVWRNHVARKGELEILEWCHLEYSSEDAKNELSSLKYQPGSFIIRCTSGCHYSEALALTVKCKDRSKVVHHRILRNDGEFTMEYANKAQEKRFPSLTRLLEYHARYTGGMPQRITYSVKKKIEVWEIEEDEIELNGVVGKGFFGDVCKATVDGHEVAVKTSNGVHMTKEQFIGEAMIARRSSHENIVKTYGKLPKRSQHRLMPGGDLRNFLLNYERRRKKLSNDENLSIVLKIVSAMAHLEKLGIVHRDLAARNVLVGPSIDVIKLADFGLARCLDETLYYKNNKSRVPYKWTAPEALLIFGSKDKIVQAGKATTASDVWSFAVVMWELYSRGDIPYKGQDMNALYRNLTVCNERLAHPKDCPDMIYELMLECWFLDPVDRPTFAQLLNFLTDYSEGRPNSKRVSGYPAKHDINANKHEETEYINSNLDYEGNQFYRPI